MNTSTIEMSNSSAKLQERLMNGQITWKWPVMIVFARLILALVAQALVAGVFMLLGNPSPWQAAAPWWIVYGTLIDIGCFLLKDVADALRYIGKGHARGKILITV